MVRSLVRVPSAVLAAASAALLAFPAAAQSEDGFDKAPEDTLAGKEQVAEEKGDKMPGEKEKPPEPESEIWDTKEDPSKAYHFINLRFRNVIVPKFMLNLFADGGATVNVFTFGPELTRRKDGTELNIAFSYADYSMDPFLFKGADDGDEAWEIVSSSMKVLYITIDLLYEIPLDKKSRMAFLIGGGVGLGGVLGNLRRNQARPDDPANLNREDVTQWTACTGPVAGDLYCDASNDHYGSYEEPSWANGGSKPFIFPWISLPQLSFRYKPIKPVQARVDAGFSLTGFFFGLSAGYGLPI